MSTLFTPQLREVGKNQGKDPLPIQSLTTRMGKISFLLTGVPLRVENLVGLTMDKWRNQPH